MSRVERKRLEKEAKKKKFLSFDSMKKEENKKTELKQSKNLKSENSIKNIVDKNKKKISDANDHIKSNQSLTDLENSGFKEIEKMMTSKYTKVDDDKLDEKVEMKTADKIISLEDERMYFERKQRNKSSVEGDVLTVDMIHTAEDIDNKIQIKTDKKTTSDDKKTEENINYIKKIEIEKATFKDIKRVAELRLAAEKGVNVMVDNKEKSMNTVDKEDKITGGKINSSNEKVIEIKKDTNSTDDKEEVINIDDKNLVKKNDDRKVVVNEEDYSYNEKKGVFFKKLLGILLLIVILTYAIGCFVFKDRFFVNTKVNGIDVSFKTPDELDEIASSKIEGYSIEIIGRNNVKDKISGDDIDLMYMKDGSSSKIKNSQGMMSWPMAFFKDDSINGKLNVSFDDEKFNDVLKELNIFKKENIKAPVSPHPDYDEKENKVVVNKGEKGSTPIESKVKEFVAASIKSEFTNVDYDNSVYLKQKNSADDPRLAKAVEEISAYSNIKIEYNFEYEKYNVSGKDIVSMFNVDSENDYAAELDKDKVRDFVRGLSKKYSTYGDTREIKSASTGETIKVSGGIYGWLIDREKETDAVYELVKAKKDDLNRTPIYAQTAMSRGKNDLGNEFIEIDLGSQHMWFVRDGEVLASTPIVSGNPNRGSATPPGIYPLNYKDRHAILRGPGYASPVAYWMPFNGDIGIHDANWQAAFGGSRYLYAGSHGCINVPYGSMSKFFSLAKKGMPVILHY